MFARIPLVGGDDGIRTHDPLLAGQVLSQLSYTPIGVENRHLSGPRVGLDLSSRTVSREVLSALVSLTSVFGMGTGGPSPFVRPTVCAVSPMPTRIELAQSHRNSCLSAQTHLQSLTLLRSFAQKSIKFLSRRSSFRISARQILVKPEAKARINIRY